MPKLVRSKFLAVVALVCLAKAIMAQAELRIGATSVNINAPLGTPLAGYYRERPCDGVLDDLHAKAAVFDDGQTKVALVVCDLIGLPRQIVLDARTEASRLSGIPAENILMAATHSHTGPVLARNSELDGVTGATNALCREYFQKLPGLIGGAVAGANAKLAPAKVFAAKSQEHELAHNRRYWMKDGSVAWNPGKLNPNIMRPVGPIDPEVGIVYFEAAEKRPVLTFVNYAMHPDTTGGSRLSADYPGVLSRRLAEYKGPDMLTIFGNGACGNINHVNTRWATAQSSPEEAGRLGTILAASVLKAYARMDPVGETRVRTKSKVIEVKLPEVSEADLVKARAVAKQGEKAKFAERVEAYKSLDVASRKGKPWEVEVQVITLGKELAWVSMPGELFVESGLNIKAASPFRQTHIVELANGSIGYIPNRSAYPEGAYEVLSARCAEGTAELLTATAIQLLDEMSRE